MRILVIISLFICFQAKGQTGNEKAQSRLTEKQAWELFFDEQYADSEKKFQEALKLDSANFQCYLGLNFIKAARDDQMDFELISKATNGDDEKIWEYGMISAAIQVYYSQPKDERKDQVDFRIAEVKAYYTDGSFKVFYDDGTIRETGQFKNQLPIGKWEYFRENGKRLKIVEYPETGKIVLFKWFKSDGEIIKEEYKEIESNFESLVKTIIYWQELPRKYGEYLFVSKEGFCVYDREHLVTFDSTTPDNVIEETYDAEKGRVWYIWKNGKREVYRACEFDGVEVTIFRGDKTGKHVWKDCKMEFIRPLNESEKKARDIGNEEK